MNESKENKEMRSGKKDSEKDMNRVNERQRERESLGRERRDMRENEMIEG